MKTNTQKLKAKSKMGFWKCWAMTVGVMIGSGVFMLPALLAPYGSLSFLGWLLTSVGAITIALVLGRLASRTEKSGGFYVYTQEAFGDLTGFIVAWGYWLSIVFATTAITVAFAGYLGAIVPSIGASTVMQAVVAVVLTWTLIAINIKGVGAGASVQLLTTILKLVPLVVIILLGVTAGSTDNIPPFNPGNKPVLGAISAVALLTMWAFLGIEAGTVAAADVHNPKRTIPRAVVVGTLTATFVYIAATAAVMMLVPMDMLETSQAPFVDAAAKLGPWGGTFIALGALVATAGAANGNILLSGQMPLAVSLDGLAPKFLARRNASGAPVTALVLSAVISTVLLVFNYSDGLLAAFTFLISMSTLCLLLPYMLSAIAELRISWRSAKGWASVALLAVVYSAVAILGSGLQIIIWGVVLFLMGLPIYYMTKYRPNTSE
ncbi:MAG: amino acid permease [Robiginitomaculum sp.]|nr:MAG: amino acid permease [Robiginitomaculum sp.]